MMYDKETILGGLGLFMGVGILVGLFSWVKEDPTNLIWLILIGIICYVVGKFFYDKKKQNEKVTKEGGMQHKYKGLIIHLLSGHSNTKILQVTADSILLDVHNTGGTTLYKLLQTFGKVTITWTVESPVCGNHKLDWAFDEYLDQNKMMEKIMTDLKQYQINVMTAH